MTTMELMMIPGMDNSRKLRKMREESRRRMNETARTQMVAAAMMTLREQGVKQEKR